MEIGDKYNRFTVLDISGRTGGRLWVRCDCGVEKSILRSHVLSGNSKSCGCLRKENYKSMTYKHGAVSHIDGKRVATPEYRAWQAMRNRCLNVRSKDYKYYGGRGIHIHPAWGDFNIFFSDMGARPSLNYTLERVDSNGNYEPSNCIWATRKTQARNRSYAKTKSWELAQQLGVKQMTAHHYIWRVRAMDRGVEHTPLSKDIELKVRAFLKNVDKSWL